MVSHVRKRSIGDIRSSEVDADNKNIVFLREVQAVEIGLTAV